VKPRSLDHLAIWTDSRHELSRLLCRISEVHEIERTEDFTLIGADAREGKLTLFDAPGPRRQGALERVVLRVADLESALASLGVKPPPNGEVVEFTAPGGLPVGLVQAAFNTPACDLDSIVLRVPDVEEASGGLEEMGFERDGDRLFIGDRHLLLKESSVGGETDRPLLNHIALLVDSVDECIEEAQRLGHEIAEVKDAPNTYAAFLWGPGRIKLEYVEHKPSFSLV